MYLEQETQINVFSFQLPWGGHLNSENRWVKLAELFPWQELEQRYAKRLNKVKGNPAKPARMAFASLYVQNKLGLTDRECAQTISENPYIQYFLGFSEYQVKPPVSSSTLYYFRKRITAEVLAWLNDKLYEARQKAEESDKDDKDPPAPAGGAGPDASDGKSNEGTIILDATCAPQDIKYPTDLTLLNDARRLLESYIDKVFRPLRGKIEKPRTDRKAARKAYLAVAKQRKAKYAKRRAAVGKQLRFVRKNLVILDELLRVPGHGFLNEQESVKLQTIRALYRQQQSMFDAGIHRVENRIVSISQPHIRPIVRGKSGSPVEFGAKISIAVKDGFCFVDQIGWDNYSEGGLLEQQCKKYYERFGCYPARVLGDKAYLSKANRRFCKQHGIELPGPRLGRPPKTIDPDEKQQLLEAGRERNEVEGRFGIGKRRYGLSLIMSKLQETSETEIMMQFIVMNTDLILRKQEQQRKIKLVEKQKIITFPSNKSARNCTYENLSFAF